MSDTPILRRRFIDVDGRRVHYLRVGEGPPVVLVHSSPTNAWYVVPHMRLLADRYTCFAFDTPGFGLSDPVAGEVLAVAEIAHALADNMVAVGLPPCPVFGTHTGAAIALSMAAHRPERVTALVLDGVPIFTPAEQAEIFEGYFEPLILDARGGHFARTWTRFRDQYLWFPWTSRSPHRHNDADLGSPAAIQTWMESFFYAAANYKPAYRAACFYGDEAIRDATAVTCPVLYTAIESDMLYTHMERLLPLPAHQEIRRIGNDRMRKDVLIGETFDRHPAVGDATSDAFALADGPGVRQQFVDRAMGQVLLRHAGSHASPAVLFLHDAPGSAESLARPDGLLLELADAFLMLAPDLPGSGGSDPIEPGRPSAATLDAWVDVLVELCAIAGVRTCCVYGIGIGASLAVRLAARHPTLVGHVVLRGLALPESEERERLRQRYAPRITIEADGSHWYRTWLMLRDQQVFFPWYETRFTNQRRVAADFEGGHLHAWTFEVMKQHGHYHEVIEAALDYDCLDDLRGLRMPLAVCHDPGVPFFAYDDALRAITPDAIDLPFDGPTHRPAMTQFVTRTVRSPRERTRGAA